MTYNVFGGTLSLTQSINICDHMWSCRLCRVVKCKSCETYWILLGRLMTTQTEQLKGRSPVCINMFTLVNDILAAQFVTQMSMRLRPQTTHKSPQ